MMLNLNISYDILDHFNSDKNMTSTILNQINSGFYDKFISYMTCGIVVDCGANIGLFSLFAAKYASKVISIEPTKSHVKVFKSLLLSNNIKNIEIKECALSSINGELDFYENKNNSTMNSLLPYGLGSHLVYKVPTCTLNVIAENINSINFLKIDIEGSEEQLKDSDEFFSTLNTVESFFFEVHDIEKVGHLDNLHKIQLNWKLLIEEKCNNFKDVVLLGHDGLWGVNVHSTRK